MNKSVEGVHGCEQRSKNNYATWLQKWINTASLESLWKSRVKKKKNFHIIVFNPHGYTEW